MPEQTTILKTENLSAGYNDQVVLNDISFSLNKGEVLVIIGQNGSGKSTLLKTLSGLLPKIAGALWLNDQMQKSIAPHELVKNGISYFVQGGLIMPALTVEEHLELASVLATRKSPKTTLDDVFRDFPKLKEVLKSKAGNLSGGERQMLSFGMLLMHGTHTWLLDEPTAGLAPAVVQLTIDFLSRKNREGVSLLLVEHNMDVAFKLATHIVVAKETTLTRKFDRQDFSQKEFLDNVVYN